MSLHARKGKPRVIHPSPTLNARVSRNTKSIVVNQEKNKGLTQNLDVPLPVDHGPGRGHVADVAAGVARHADAEVDRLLRVAARVVVEAVDVHLERGDGRPVVLRQGRQHAAPAAVGDLLLDRGARWEVHHDGPLLAAMRSGAAGARAMDAGALALLRRLPAPRLPDDLIPGPRPAQPPPRALDVAVQLVIMDARHDLRPQEFGWFC